MNKQEIIETIKKEPNTLFKRMGSRETTRFIFELFDADKLRNRYFGSGRVYQRESRNQGNKDRIEREYEDGICWSLYSLAPESVEAHKDPDYNLKKKYGDYVLQTDDNPLQSYEQFKESMEKKIQERVEELKIVRDNNKEFVKELQKKIEDHKGDKFFHDLYKKCSGFGCYTEKTRNLLGLILSHTEKRQINLNDYRDGNSITLDLPSEPVIYFKKLYHEGRLISNKGTFMVSLDEPPRLATDEELEAHVRKYI